MKPVNFIKPEGQVKLRKGFKINRIIIFIIPLFSNYFKYYQKFLVLILFLSSFTVFLFSNQLLYAIIN